MASYETMKEIYEWIDTITFSRVKKNISRDFSDAVLMAELLKKHYPQKVEIHNYNASNSISKKIENWRLLNRKVLSKLELKLRNETIDQLARSESGIIEKVLINFRKKIIQDCNNSEFMYEGGQGETVRSIISASEGIIKTTVPKQAYTRLKKDVQDRDEKIRSLEERILHLENMLKLKNGRIMDLESRCQQLAET